MYRNKDSFNEQNRISKPAVDAIIKSFQAWDHWLVVDTQNNKRYQEKDIDIILDDIIFIEVKFDTKMYNTGNLYCENVSCVEVGSKGWLWKSEADLIYYCEYKPNDLCVCHIFKLDELRNYVNENHPRLIKHWDYSDRKTKSAYLVHIDKVKKFESYDKFLLAI